MDRLPLLHQLATDIDRISADSPVRVAMDGPDAAGKTTMANELGEILGGMGRQVIRATIDGFHQPRAIRYSRGDLSPEGYYRDSFDYETLVGNLLEPLGLGGSRHYRDSSFDYVVDRPCEGGRADCARRCDSAV